MTQEIRKDLSVAAAMAMMVCAGLLLISAKAAAEHVQQREPTAVRIPDIQARPR
jgi:hypothetical protein